MRRSILISLFVIVMSVQQSSAAGLASVEGGECPSAWQPYVDKLNTLFPLAEAPGIILFASAEDGTTHDCLGSLGNQAQLRRIEEFLRFVSALRNEHSGTLTPEEMSECTASSGRLGRTSFIAFLIPNRTRTGLSVPACAQRMLESYRRDTEQGKP